MNAVQLVVALMQELNISTGQALRLIRTAQHQYRHYTIPKRSGGVRHIFHPTPLLKNAQRWIVSHPLRDLPVHDAVFSYRCGRSIKDHAEQHVRSNFLLRIDFKDFFPSIDQEWVSDFLRSYANCGRLQIDDDAQALISKLVCRFNQDDKSMALSIGAPSSPSVSNAILYDLDCAAFAIARKYAAIYTRYADDVFFSSREPNILRQIEEEYREAASRVTPKLTINDEKTERRSRRVRRIITGLVVTPTREVSLGRERKRSIRSRVYLFTQGKLSDVEIGQLTGLLAYANDVENRFLVSLRRKFGEDVIAELLCRPH